MGQWYLEKNAALVFWRLSLLPPSGPFDFPFPEFRYSSIIPLPPQIICYNKIQFNRGRSVNKTKQLRNKGFTFIELLLAVFVLSVGISAVLMLYTSSMLSAATAWDMTVATSNAEHMLEEMQARDSLADIVNTDWPLWGQEHGLNTLPAETFSVAFADPAADPLNIQITVNWKRQLRASQIILRTRLTK